MTTRTLLALFVAVFAISFLTAGRPAHAQSAITCDETASIDLNRLMTKVDKMFFSGKFAEKYPDAARIKFFLDKIGILDLDTYTAEFHLGQGKLYERCSLTMDPKKDASLLSKLSKLPDREITIGDVISPSSALAMVSILNPAEKLELYWQAVSDPELWDELEKMGPAGDISQARSAIQMADMMLGGVGGFDAIKEMVGDELDLMLLEVPDGDVTTPDFPWDKTVVFLALKLDDPDNFRKSAGGMLDQLLKSEPVFTAAGVKFYPLEDDIVFGIGKGFLLAGTNPPRLKEILSTGHPGIKSVTANAYLRIDLNTLWHKHLDPLTKSDMIPYPADATAMHKEFWDITPETDFGALEVAWHSEPNAFSYELKANDDVVNLFAMLYTWVLAVSVSEGIQAQQQLAAEPQGPEPVSTDGLYAIQQAIEAYKEANGEYPRTADELVEKGSLVEFPTNQYTGSPMMPRWPTDWAAGDFCYRPYIVDGVVTEYYLLLFGGDQYGGMDVISPANAFEARMWTPETDGKPDGVALVLEGRMGITMEGTVATVSSEEAMATAEGVLYTIRAAEAAFYAGNGSYGHLSELRDQTYLDSSFTGDALSDLWGFGISLQFSLGADGQSLICVVNLSDGRVLRLTESGEITEQGGGA